MASTGSVVYSRHKITGSTVPTRHTGSIGYTTYRAISGLYTAVGVVAAINARNKKIAPPRIGDTIGWVTIGGQRHAVTFEPAFHRFIVQELHDRRLGGADGATLPDVVSTVETTQSEAATVAAQVGGISQMNAQNVEVLAAVRESAQSAALPGASQIPPVQRTSFIEP